MSIVGHPYRLRGDAAVVIVRWAFGGGSRDVRIGQSDGDGRIRHGDEPIRHPEARVAG